MPMNRRHHAGRLLRNLLIPAAIMVSSILAGDAESAFTDGTNPELSINLISFESSQGDIMARLHLKLPKSELNSRFSPKHDYALVDELTINESVLRMSSSNPYSAFNNSLATEYQVHDAGSQFFYPFDDHVADIRIFVDRTDGGIEQRVPVKLDTTLCSFEGYKINLTPASDHATDYVHLQVELQRTLPIRLFTIFISVLMLTVAIGFMNMVRKLVKSKAPPDINELAFGAALLFAFPAIRSIQPFVPPMGVLSDFVGFFWAETIVAGSLIAYLNCWIKRKIHD